MIGIDYLKNIFSGIAMKLIITVIILLVGFIIGRIIGKLTQRVLHEISMNSVLKKATGARIPIEEMAGSFVAYFIYLVAIIIALRKLGLDTIVFDLLFGGVLLVIILAFFLGIKDFIPNTIAGIFIHKRKNIKIGDKIKIKGTEGIIIKINLVETKIKTDSGDIIHIPNSILTKEKIVVKKK